MGTRSRPVDRAVRRIEEDLHRVLLDIGSGRRNAGLSFDTIGAACHVDGSTAARVVSGETLNPDLRLLAAMAATVGQELRLRVFPSGDPIRDVGQQRLLARFRPRVGARLRWRTEVPLPLDGDLRAWDAVVSGDGWAIAVEAETVLDDLQALERRIALKKRDSGMARVILVVANTRRNRRALAAAPAAFVGMRGHARRVLGALGQGLEPGDSAVVLL